MPDPTAPRRPRGRPRKAPGSPQAPLEAPAPEYPSEIGTAELPADVGSQLPAALELRRQAHQATAYANNVQSLRGALDKLTDQEAIDLGIVKPARTVQATEDVIASTLAQARTFGWLPGLDFYARIRPAFDPIFWIEAGLSDSEIVAKMVAEVPGIDKRKAGVTVRQSKKLYSAVKALERQGDITVAQHAIALAGARQAEIDRARKLGEITGDWAEYEALTVGAADEARAAGARSRAKEGRVRDEIERAGFEGFERADDRRRIEAARAELRGEAWEPPAAEGDTDFPTDNPGAATKRRAALRSPTRTQLEAGARTFRKWHAFPPERVEIVRGPTRVPRLLVKLGTLPEIVYDSDKWSGKRTTYVHKTGRGNAPLLCTDPTGRNLFIVGGKVRVTKRGLIG